MKPTPAALSLAIEQNQEVKQKLEIAREKVVRLEKMLAGLEEAAIN